MVVVWLQRHRDIFVLFPFHLVVIGFCVVRSRLLAEMSMHARSSSPCVLCFLHKINTDYGSVQMYCWRFLLLFATHRTALRLCRFSFSRFCNALKSGVHSVGSVLCFCFWLLVSPPQLLKQMRLNLRLCCDATRWLHFAQHIYNQIDVYGTHSTYLSSS